MWTNLLFLLAVCEPKTATCTAAHMCCTRVCAVDDNDTVIEMEKNQIMETVKVWWPALCIVWLARAIWKIVMELKLIRSFWCTLGRGFWVSVIILSVQEMIGLFDYCDVRSGSDGGAMNLSEWIITIGAWNKCVPFYSMAPGKEIDWR